MDLTRQCATAGPLDREDPRGGFIERRATARYTASSRPSWNTQTLVRFGRYDRPRQETLTWHAHLRPDDCRRRHRAYAIATVTIHPGSAASPGLKSPSSEEFLGPPRSPTTSALPKSQKAACDITQPTEAENRQHYLGHGSRRRDVPFPKYRTIGVSVMATMKARKTGVRESRPKRPHRRHEKDADDIRVRSSNVARTNPFSVYITLVRAALSVSNQCIGKINPVKHGYRGF